MKYKIVIEILIALIIIIGIGFLVYKNNKQNEGYDLKIYFFDAGKADCILISNNDKYVLIDTGERSLSGYILNYLKNNNITKLDYLIITHFDKDHVGSASKIIENIEIGTVLQSNSPKDSDQYSDYISSLKNEGIDAITVSGDLEFNLDDLNFVVNGPEDLYSSSESNNSSLIVEMSYKNTNFLFMGDAENDRIKDYLKLRDSNISYNFVKIPYHGNYQKQTKKLLNWCNPKYAVITCSNSEPDTSETEEVLKEKKISYYMTKNGDITITSNGNEIKIKQ